MKTKLTELLKGLIPYDYAVLGIMMIADAPVNAVAMRTGTVYAQSFVHAVALVSELHPDHVIRSIRARHLGVCINLLLAQPCRFSRRVWNHAGWRDSEVNGRVAVFFLQTRQAVVIEDQLAREWPYPAIPSDASPNHATPQDFAEGTLGRWDSVIMDKHSGATESPAKPLQAVINPASPQPHQPA